MIFERRQKALLWSKGLRVNWYQLNFLSSPTETYSAFIAELQAQRRVFSLNLERHAFIKVQFLYTEGSSTKETYMLVMLHKECKFVSLQNLIVYILGLDIADKPFF